MDEPPTKKKKRKEKPTKGDSDVDSENIPPGKEVPAAEIESIRSEVASMIKDSGVSVPEDLLDKKKKKKEKKKKEKEGIEPDDAQDGGGKTKEAEPVLEEGKKKKKKRKSEAE